MSKRSVQKVETEEPETGQRKTVACRLRKARQEAGMSRQQLADATDIPVKSIEKFEYGTMEPSFPRLRVLCKTLGVSRDWIETGEGSPFATDKPPVPANDQGRPGEPDQPDAIAEGETHEEAAKNLLAELDDMRADGFETAPRQAMAMANELLATLKHLEAGDLLYLAEDRGLHKGACSTRDEIDSLFSEDPDKAQGYCGQIEERILDTAILGADLYAIEHEALTELADRLDDEGHEIGGRGFLGWGDHDELIPALRPVLRSLAFAGKAVNFGDKKVFPRRE
jgi:transcriptional regulator with XRE-family HTH domain